MRMPDDPAPIPEIPEGAPEVHEIPEGSEVYTIYISLTADGTEVQKGRSYTPVTSKVLNLGSDLRSMLSNIRLHAIFPPKVNDYNSLFRPIAEEFHRYRPDGGHPIRVDSETGSSLYIYVHLAYTVNDMRGVPACCGGHYPPCSVGSCVFCAVAGIHRQSRTVVPGAVRALPKSHALRKEYAKEFAKDRTLKTYALLGRPAKRKREQVEPSVRRVQRRESKPAEEPFVSLTPFAQLLNYHDPTKHTFSDNAHALANGIKLWACTVTNTSSKKGKVAFGPKQKKAETDTGRFAYLQVNKTPKPR